MPKTQTNAELILASRNAETGDILYTFKQTFPRIILAEVNTHLIASKNAASSRAIPTLKQLKNILKDPFLPVRIGQYQSGMQAGQEITGLRRILNEKIWLWGRYPMVVLAYLSYKLGAPKQFSNRLVEPWMWVEQIWSATDVDNELKLRDSSMAEPHYETLASQKRLMIERVRRHFSGLPQPGIMRKLQELHPGEWHLPFVDKFEFAQDLEREIQAGNIRFQTTDTKVWNPQKENWLWLPGIVDEVGIAKAVSAARCAWVSYYMPGQDSKKMSNILAALSTYEKLATGGHLSPLQHVATPLPFTVRVAGYRGWLMFRKEIPGESGGDPVVPSITPAMAKTLLNDYENDDPDMLDNLVDEFRREVEENMYAEA